jgi:MFS family permease
LTTSTSTPTFWRHFGLLLGVNVLWLPLSMLFNSLQSLVLPVFVLRFVSPAEKGTVLGLILFVGLAAGALIQPAVGSYSDRLSRGSDASHVRWGRRQPVIVVGALLTLALLAGFAFADSIWVLAAAYVGVSLAAGIAQAGYQGLLPDLVPPTLRGGASGLKGFLELLGSVIGFTVAGILIKKGQPTGVVFAGGILLVVGGVVSLALVREGKRLRLQAAQHVSHQPAAQEHPVALPPAGPVTTLAQQAAREQLPAPDGPGGASPFLRVMVGRFLFLFGVYGIGHFLLYYVRDRLHLSSSTGAGTTSALLTIFTIVTALVALSGGVVSDRVGRLPVLWVASGLSALGALLLAPANSVATILVGGTVMSVGSGLFASANWALTADLTPHGAGGRFYGLLALATGGATAIAGLLGPVVDHFGYTPLFVLSAVTFSLSAVLLPRAAHVAQPAKVATT